MAEFMVEGQRVEIDTSDNPSQEEIGRRIDEYFTAQTNETTQVVQAPAKEESHSIEHHLAEIPEGVASGVVRGVANIDRQIDKATNGAWTAMGDWFNENVANLGYLRIDQNGRVSWAENKTTTEDVELLNTETLTGDIVEGISQFATGFVTAKKARTALLGDATTKSGKLAGYTSDMLLGGQIAFDPHEDNLANFVQRYPQLENPVTEYLAVDKDDSEAEARFKMALIDLGLEAVSLPIIAMVRSTKNAMKGAEPEEVDIDTLTKFMDENSDVGISLNELDDKIEAAVQNEAKLRTRYNQADEARANNDMTGKEVEVEKAAAREEAIENTDDTILKYGQDQYGYGVKKSNEQLIREADDVLAEHFGDSGSVSDLMGALKSTVNVKDFDVYMTATGRLLQRTSRNYAMALQAKNSAQGNLEKLYKQIDKDTSLSAKDKTLAKMQAKNGLDGEMAIYRQQRNDYLESIQAFRGASTTGGRAVQINKMFQNFDVPAEAVEKKFDELLMRAGNQQIRNNFAMRALNAMKRGTGKTLRMLDELFITSILSSGKTHIINTVSGGMQTIYLPAERLLAAGVRTLFDGKGGAKDARAVMAQYGSMRHQVVESGRMALQTYKTGKNVLDNKNTVEDTPAIGRDLEFSMDTLKGLARMVDGNGDKITLADLLGTAMRATSTRALGAEDEFWKQLNFRSYITGRAYSDGFEVATAQGLKGQQAKDFAKAHADTALTRAYNEQSQLSANGLSSRLGMEQYRAEGLQYAREATFTQGLEKGGASFQNMVASVPLARQLFPFVRTPLNIISAAIQRSPLAPLSGRWWKDLTAGGERTSLALTRLAIGTSVTYGVMSNWAENDIQFTGNLSSNFARRQNMQELGGHIAGSIVMPDGTQYQISRFDPFSSIFEGIGVIQELYREGKTEQADSLGLELGLAMTNMLANDTYATSVRQLMFALQSEGGLDKFLRGRTGQLVPFSGAMRSFTALDDPYQRELRSHLDAIKATLPGFSDQVPPRYNVLGEVVERPKYADLGFMSQETAHLVSPIMTGKKKTDPVAVEIVNQKVSAVKQSPIVANGAIDLNDAHFAKDETGKAIYKDNRTAYDHYNYILANSKMFDGLTLREFLGSVIKMPEYQDELTDFKMIETPYGKKRAMAYGGTRNEILTQIISDAKKMALEELSAANPAVLRARQKHQENQAMNKAQSLQAQQQQLFNLNPEGN
jgi:hypothetical protein